MSRLSQVDDGAVMATSVWDTGDNDGRIAERIKEPELLFDPRQKAGCGGFWDQASAGKESFADARSEPNPKLSHTPFISHLVYRLVIFPIA